LVSTSKVLDSQITTTEYRIKEKLERRKKKQTESIKVLSLGFEYKVLQISWHEWDRGLTPL
jgi:hypothetical protein